MKLIMFDYDGVIMDTWKFTRSFYKELSEEFSLGIPDNEDYLKELLELDWKQTLKKLGLTTKEQLDRNEVLFRQGLKKFSMLIKPYEEIGELFSRLSENHALAVVTNNYSSEVMQRMKKFNIFKHIKSVYGGESGNLKPSQFLLNKCMHELCAKPEDCVYVGDMDGDITAARKAKVSRVVAATYGYHSIARLKGADAYAGSVHELGEILLNRRVE